jgi:hypothetical protein
MGGARGAYGGEEKCIQRSRDEIRRKKPIGKPRRIWENNINMSPKKVRREAVDSIHLPQDRDM